MKPAAVLRSLLVFAVLANTLGLRARDDRPEAPRQYRLSFDKSKVIQGLRASPMKLPLDCTTDGTVFVDLFDPGPVINPGDSVGQFLAAITPSGSLREIRLSAVNELHGIQEIKHFVSDSGVVFLVRAFSADSTGDPGAERHFYAVIFDREGRDHHIVKLDEEFHFVNIAAFKSGLLLAYAYDEVTRVPRLAMLKEDGSILKYLQPDDGTVPESALSQGPGGKGPAVFVAPTQFVAYADSIFVVQNHSKFPLLKVNESGAVTVIRPKLPAGDSILMLIPSDENLFALANRFEDGLIYELSPEDGTVIGRIEVGSKEPGRTVACVHDGKFVSIQLDPGSASLLSAIGSLAPISGRTSPGRNRPVAH